jgi:hypothetical protein
MASQVPSCKNQGCAAGLRRVCCISDDSAPGASTYSSSFYAGQSGSYLDITRETASGATSDIVLTQSSDGSYYPITVPDGWSFLSANDYADQNGTERPVIGLLGSVAFGRGADCTLDLDFTLFVLDANDSIVQVHFKTKDVPVSDFTACH